MEELTLPELGENIETAEVAAVLVAVGDRVRRDQPVIEVETEKASLEVPSTVDGVVAELLVQPGDKIGVGQVILRLELASDEAEASSADSAAASERAPDIEVADGDGPEPSSKGSEATSTGEPESPSAADSDVIDFPVRAGSGRPQIGETVPAAPSVRSLARQLGLDIRRVRGSGPGGRISHADVKAEAKRIVTGSRSAPGVAAPTLPDFAQWGPVRTEPLSAVRRATARNMTTAWSTVPHVTQFDHANITQLESLRKRFNQRDDARGRKLTMTAIVVKMVAAALKQFPKFNASLDTANDAVVYKEYFHVGVAVDTERGLLVPVVRDVERKNLVQVAAEIAALAGKARERKLALDEMGGACFTVSNLGGLGTTYFSPIVNWPQVAILGVGRAEQQAVYEVDGFRPRLILPLSLSYDHRLVDGADAARFLRWLAEALEQPLLLLLDD